VELVWCGVVCGEGGRRGMPPHQQHNHVHVLPSSLRNIHIDSGTHLCNTHTPPSPAFGGARWCCWWRRIWPPGSGLDVWEGTGHGGSGDTRRGGEGAEEVRWEQYRDY
jgi:hypothetical protein